MSATNDKIIEMILNDATANEISNITGLSNKQLFYRLNMLKTKGYNFSRKYYYDGEIAYFLNKGFEIEDDIHLLTSPKDRVFKAIFLSDLHLACIEDRVDLLNEVYNFCAKEGINIIINGGDIIDGFLGKDKFRKFKTSQEQIEYALKSYPYDKNILNFICLGNHDYSILEKTGQNLETILLAKRHDIISLGYGVGNLKIKDDQIVVRHPKTPISKNIDPVFNGLVLIGHTHRPKNVIHGNRVNIYLPSLSDKDSWDRNSLPGFVKATISFNNGVFTNGVFEQYLFMDKLYKVNESSYALYSGAKTSNDPIKYEENRVSYQEKVKAIKHN